MGVLAKRVLSLALLILIALPIASIQYTEAQMQEATLRVGIPGEIDNLNPLIGVLAAGGYVRSLIFDTLLLQPTNRSFIPWLAESYEVDEENLKITFKLRPNLKWHDGMPLTAKDVEFTFNLIINSEYTEKIDRWNLRGFIEYVKATDDRTVEFKLKEPFAPALWYIGILIPILPAHIWSNVDPTTFKNLDNPVGSGPFKFVKYTPGVSIELEANPDYFMGRPKIDKLVIVLYKSTSSMMLDLQAGNIDTISAATVSPELVPVLLKDPNIRIVQRPDLGFIRFLAFNLMKYPFNIREFREAVAYAIDKEAIVKTVMLGYADPAADGYVQKIQGIWYNPEIGYRKQDFDKARSILDSIGFKDTDGDGIRETPNGTKLSFTLLTISGRVEFERTAELISKWLKEIGIEAKVEAQALGTVDQREGVGDFELGLMGVGGLGAEIDFYLFTRFHSSGAKPLGEYAPRNWFRYKNPEMDQLLEAQRRELDLQKRIELIYKIQEIIKRDIPIIPLYVKRYLTAYRTDNFVNWNEQEGPSSKLSLLQVELKKPEVKTVVETVKEVVTATEVVTEVKTQVQTIVKEGRTVVTTVPQTVVQTVVVTKQVTETPAQQGLSVEMAVAMTVVVAVIVGAIAYMLARRR